MSRANVGRGRATHLHLVAGICASVFCATTILLGDRLEFSMGIVNSLRGGFLISRTKREKRVTRAGICILSSVFYNWQQF